MGPLDRQAIVQGVSGILLMVVLIFWPAGTFDYWQGWLCLGMFSGSTFGFTVYLAIYDRQLLERRMKAGPQYERERSQKIIVSLAFLALFALIVLPAIDYRYAWSPVAPWVSILGDVLILLSFLFSFWVIRLNSFAASNIRVEKDQKVIDTGQYAYVRHPMYAARIWLLVGMPLALGSSWSLGLDRSVDVGAGVAAPRRGEDPGERFARVYGIHAPGTLSSGSVRVVEATRRGLFAVSKPLWREDLLPPSTGMFKRLRKPLERVNAFDERFDIDSAACERLDGGVEGAATRADERDLVDDQW